MQLIETRTACNTTKHTWTRVRGAERTRDPALTQWQKMERECPNPDKKRNSRHKCWDPNTTLHTKQCTQTRERTARAHSKPRAHMKTRTWWEYQGSVTKPWITLDRSDRTLTLWQSSDNQQASLFTVCCEWESTIYENLCADLSSVVCKLQELDRGVSRCAVIGVQGEEQWGENTALRSSSADCTGAGW